MSTLRLWKYRLRMWRDLKATGGADTYLSSTVPSIVPETGRSAHVEVELSFDYDSDDPEIVSRVRALLYTVERLKTYDTNKVGG